jgi:CBS domain containing-hemolysin-like protein
LDEEEHQLITSALGFDTSVVSSVMVPTTEVESINESVTPAEIERMCARTGFSRFPIRSDTDADVNAAAGATHGSVRFAGYLHIRDVVDIPADRRDEPVPPDRIRELPLVAPTTDLRTALDRMRRIGAHLAKVVDASGSDGTVVGVVMLEDVIEALICDVQDSTRRAPERATPPRRRSGA